MQWRYIWWKLFQIFIHVNHRLHRWDKSWWGGGGSLSTYYTLVLYNYNLVEQWAIACLKSTLGLSQSCHASPLLPIARHKKVHSTIWPSSIGKYVHKYCILKGYHVHENVSRLKLQFYNPSILWFNESWMMRNPSQWIYFICS